MESDEHANTTTVLLVDDDALFRKSLARQLRAQVDGIYITEASDFDSARAMIERFTFNIVLSDYNLKCGLTGFNVLDYTRVYQKSARRVLMSGEVFGPGTLEDWLDRGILHNFWNKNVAIADLFRVLELEPTGLDESSTVEDINGEAEAIAVEESEEGDDQAEPVQANGFHRFSCSPIEKVEGRLKRAHVQEHLAEVFDTFINTYDWKGDLDWFVAGSKTRPPSDRERKWLQAELAKIHEHVHNRIGKNYD